MPVTSKTGNKQFAGSGAPIPPRGLESRAAPGSGKRRTSSATGLAASLDVFVRRAEKIASTRAPKFFGSLVSGQRRANALGLGN
jgi:hypothetical protein